MCTVVFNEVNGHAGYSKTHNYLDISEVRKKSRNQRYESWRMPYGESCSMPHAHAATRIHTVDLAHSSLVIPRV